MHTEWCLRPDYYVNTGIYSISKMLNQRSASEISKHKSIFFKIYQLETAVETPFWWVSRKIALNQFKAISGITLYQIKAILIILQIRITKIKKLSKRCFSNLEARKDFLIIYKLVGLCLGTPFVRNNSWGAL